jgi:hypothetical protein
MLSEKRSGPGPIPIPIPEPVVAVEPIAVPPIIEIPREFPLYPPPTPTISSPVDTTLSVSTTRISRSIPLPGSVASRSVAPSELSVSSVRSVPPPLPGPTPIHLPKTLPTTMSLLTSVTESTPSTLTPSPPASPRAPPSPFIRESLWAPETDDIYESSILVASPSVQSIYFPEPQDISSDMSSCGLPPLHTLLKSRVN